MSLGRPGKRREMNRINDWSENSMIMLEEKDKNKNKIRNDQNLNLNMHLNRDWYKEKFNPVTMISSCLQK